MPAIACPLADCEYVTEDVESSAAAMLLLLHNNVHTSTPTTRTPTASNKQRAPKLERPKITSGSSEEAWNSFETRWSMFKRGTELSAGECVQHLFECCDEDLSEPLLKRYADAVSSTEANLLAATKQLAVIPVALSVLRAELLSTRQDHGESTWSFFAKIKGKATTCSYSRQCSSRVCTHVNDYTDMFVKDVLIAGLADDEIKKEVLGWTDLDTKTVEETVSFIEAEEMARDAMCKTPPVTASISGYKAQRTTNNGQRTMIQCGTCKSQTEKFVWNQRQKKTIEVSLCLSCWKAANIPKKKDDR